MPRALSIAAVLLVGLSGCVGASGLGVTGADAVDQVAPTTDATATTEASGTTADSTSADSTTASPAPSTETPTEDPSTATSVSETEAVTTDSTSTGSSSGASSSSSDGSSGADGSSSSDTTATETSDAPEPEGPQRGEVVSDDSIQVLSHDIKDYPDGQASVGGSLQNPTDRRLDLVGVTVVLYDETGAEIGRQTTTVSDLAPGDSATYVASFEDVDYLDVDRYLIEATEEEAQAGTPTETSTTPDEPSTTPTGTSTTPTGTSTTPTAAPTETQAGTPTETPAETGTATTTPSVSTPPPETETPLPPQGLVSDCAQPVVDDPPAKVVDCQMEDYPQPRADVQVVVGNAGDETLDRVRVTLLLFDQEGNVVERAVQFVNDLPAGESFGYLYETETDYEELSGRYVVVVQEVG